MKKLLALILVLGILFTLCACGAKSDANNEATENKPSDLTQPVPTDCSHEWQAATCTQPRMCAKCDKAEGHVLGHKLNQATCTEPQTCARCGMVSSPALGHNFSGGKCTICGTADPDY